MVALSFEPLFHMSMDVRGQLPSIYGCHARGKRQQQGFKSQPSAQRFLTTHTAIYNTFYVQRHLISRPTLRRFRAEAKAAWAAAVA